MIENINARYGMVVPFDSVEQMAGEINSCGFLNDENELIVVTASDLIEGVDYVQVKPKTTQEKINFLELVIACFENEAETLRNDKLLREEFRELFLKKTLAEIADRQQQLAILTSKKKYMNPNTGTVRTYDEWDYINEDGETVNAVDKKEVLEVVKDNEGQWIEA